MGIQRESDDSLRLQAEGFWIDTGVSSHTARSFHTRERALLINNSRIVWHDWQNGIVFTRHPSWRNPYDIQSSTCKRTIESFFMGNAKVETDVCGRGLFISILERRGLQAPNGKVSNLTVTETWQHQYIVTNGIRMHYVVQGEGPLIVLLHGFPEFWYSWRYQISFLAEHGYTVVAPDLRGYNETDKPRKGYDIPTLLCDIQGLIKGLGQQKAIIVGHDWGGVLAWTFAMSYPAMTGCLIVMNAPHPAAMMREMRTLKQLRKSWYVFAFQIPWLPEYLLGRNNAHEIGRMLRGAALQKSAFPSEVTARYQKAMSKPGAIHAAISYYRQLFLHMPRSFKKYEVQIQVPTLLIWGEQDIALGIELTTGLERWVNDIQIKRIPSSGHWVQQEQPEEVNQYILDFLQAINTPSSG